MTEYICNNCGLRTKKDICDSCKKDRRFRTDTNQNENSFLGLQNKLNQRVVAEIRKDEKNKTLDNFAERIRKEILIDDIEHFYVSSKGISKSTVVSIIDKIKEGMKNEK
jgi:predicted ATP-dependent serine protease